MGVAIDRLSSLPREILVSMILSLLHTKECVRTCVLSKRWEHLWREVPAIKLEFIDPDCYYVGRPTDPLFSRLYGVNEDNVDFLLAGRRQSSSIMRLELSCPEFHPAISLKAKAWIDYCVERKVQELIIDLGDNDSLSWLTSSVLSHCPTLKCLQFTAAKIVDSFNINDYSCLRNLRDLRLSEVKYFSGDSLERLVSNCPKLKRLRLYGKFDALNILSSSLERLELAAKRFSEVSISCPNLEFFSFENRMYKRYNGEMYFRGDMPSLVEAEMYIPSATKLVNPFMAQVLKSIKHVEVLNLEFDFEEEDHSSNLLDAARNFLPTFHELESLCLVSCFHSLCMKVLILFLKCSPNLKFLQLEHVDDEVNKRLKNCACGSERCDDRKLVDSLSDLLAPLEEAKIVHKDESETYKNGFLSSFSNYVFVQE